MDLTMVGMFTLGVMLIFIAFGMLILYVNQNFLGNFQNVLYIIDFKWIQNWINFVIKRGSPLPGPISNKHII